MKKWVRSGLIGLGVVAVGIQFYRPERSNPPVEPGATYTAVLDVPADVRHLVERACTDCHSHGTDWPWYSNVAPVSWLVADHVNHGREYVNFDTWASYGDYDAQKILDEIAEEVSEEKMPLPTYLPLHPEAQLLDSERQRIAEWARGERDRILAQMDPAQLRRAEEADEGHEGHDHDDH